MANLRKIERDLEALNQKMDALMEHHGVSVGTRRAERQTAEEKARKHWSQGGRGFKAINGSPFDYAEESGEVTPSDMDNPDFAAGVTAGAELSGEDGDDEEEEEGEEEETEGEEETGEGETGPKSSSSRRRR